MNAILSGAISHFRNRISTALFTVSAVFYFAGATGVAAESGFTNVLTAVDRLDTAHLRAVHNARDTFKDQRHARAWAVRGPAGHHPRSVRRSHKEHARATACGCEENRN